MSVQINDCTRFLLAGFQFKPLYLQSISYLSEIGFRNIYLCKQYKVKRYIYLEFDYKYSKEFLRFHKYIKSKKDFIDVIYEDKKIIYIIEFPEYFKCEYDYFIKGKYSKFSNGYKSLFSKVYKHGGKLVTSKIYSILHKDIFMKKEIELKYQIEIGENDEYYPLWTLKDNIYGY